MNLKNYVILDENNNPVLPDSIVLVKKADYEINQNDSISLSQLLSLLPDIQQQ